MCNVATGCNGVALYCYNENHPVYSGLDGSGGADNWADGDAGDYNYWQYVASYEPNGNDGAYIVCPYSDEQPVNGTANDPRCEAYAEPNVYQGSIKRCIGPGWEPEGFNAFAHTSDGGTWANWSDEGYHDIDDFVKGLCTAECDMHSQNNLSSRCQDGNWTDVQTQSAWDPSQGKNCNTESNANGGDQDGSGIDWSLVGGSSSPSPLDCDLDGDCTDDFFANIAPWIVPSGAPADLIEPETRRARYLGVDDTGSQVKLDMKDAMDDTQPIHGVAEYSASDCGDDVCPFYLANLSAYNTHDSWHIGVPTPIGTLDKYISNVQIDLLQSTLGTLNTNVDYVAFAPGTLRFRVEFRVTAGCRTCSTYADGTHAYLVENQDYAFAAWDGGTGSLDLLHTFELPGGNSGTLDISVVPAEEPPAAAHDLQSTEECDDIDGLVLDEARSSSSDPDNDIEMEFWWVNGSPAAHGTVLPFGSSYQISLEVRDERGATDRTEPEWVYVSVGTACSL